MKLQDAPEKVKPFLFHGVDIDSRGSESVGTCPFCKKHGHFGIKNETGQFRCVRCETTGNIYTFLNKLHEMALENTTAEQYKELSKARGLSVAFLKRWGLAVSPLTDEWLVPMYNVVKKSLVNMGRVVSADPSAKFDLKKVRVITTPGCKVQPFGANLVESHHTTVHVAEGLWDGIAMDEALHETKKSGEAYIPSSTEESLSKTHGVMAAPGAGNFQAEWLEVFNGRRVYITFDSDHPKKLPSGAMVKGKDGKPLKPGFDGQERIKELAGESQWTPQALLLMKWGTSGYDPAKPDGYDFRDLRKDLGNQGSLSYLFKMSERVAIVKRAGKKQDVIVLEPIERSSFTQWLADWKAHLHVTQALEDTLAIMSSVLLSTTLGGDQLWFRLIGPPGSGKTTVAEAFSCAREYTCPRSILTGIHSGFTSPAAMAGPNQRTDASLIEDFRNMMVIIKDGDTLIQAANRDKILSELRDIYDRITRNQYRNFKKTEYIDLNMTFMLCGTDTLRELNRDSLGERFLDCEILGEGEHKAFLRSSSKNTFRKFRDSLKKIQNDGTMDDISEDGEVFLKRTTYGFLKYLKTNLHTFPIPEESERVHDRIESAAQFVSYMRAHVKKDGHDLAFRPRAELATRLTAQFTKLSGCIALTLGKAELDNEVLRLVRKVVVDTAKGFRLEVVEALYKRKTGYSLKQLEILLNIPETTLRRIMAEMVEFKMVERKSVPNKSGQRGRDLHIWMLTPKIRALFYLGLVSTVEDESDDAYASLFILDAARRTEPELVEEPEDLPEAVEEPDLIEET